MRVNSVARVGFATAHHAALEQLATALEQPGRARGAQSSAAMRRWRTPRARCPGLRTVSIGDDGACPPKTPQRRLRVVACEGIDRARSRRVRSALDGSGPHLSRAAVRRLRLRLVSRPRPTRASSAAVFLVGDFATLAVRSPLGGQLLVGRNGHPGGRRPRLSSAFTYAALDFGPLLAAVGQWAAAHDQHGPCLKAVDVAIWCRWPMPPRSDSGAIRS